MKLSLILITHGRFSLLSRCLESLKAEIEPGIEAWIGFNGPGEEESRLAETLTRSYPWARALTLERDSKGGARNRLVGKAAGELLYFLDDDTTVPQGFLRRVLATFDQYPEAPCIGGPNIRPPHSDAFQRSVDAFFRSPLGAGPMRIRYIRDGKTRPMPGWCFTLSNLGARASVFREHSILFPTNCVCAEENLFLHHVEKKLGKPVYSPDLYVYHQRRDRVMPFSLQLFHYGRGRMQITKTAPSSLQPIVLSAVLFLAYLSLLPLFQTPYRFLPLAFYGAILALESSRLAFQEKDPLAAAWTAVVFPLAHLSYAVGLLSALLRR